MKITQKMKRFVDRRDMELEIVENDDIFNGDMLYIWSFYDVDMGEPVVVYRINDDDSLGFVGFSDQKGEDWPAHINADDWDTLKRVIDYAKGVGPKKD